MARLFDRAVFTEKLPFARLRVTCRAYMSVQMGQTLHLGAEIVVMAGLLCLFTVGGDWSIWRREMRPRCGVSRTHWLGSVSLEHILLSFRGRYWLHCSYAGEVSAWDIILFLSSSRCVRCLSRHTILSPFRITDTPPPCQCLHCSFSGLTMSQASWISHILIQGWDLCPSWKHTAFYIHTMITAKGAVLVQVMSLYYSWLFTEERGFAAVF